jgi:ankyrin repeat protein
MMFLAKFDIHSACWRGDLGEVKRYLKAGGDIEKKNSVSSLTAGLSSYLIFQNGDTPLSLACLNGNTEVASLLIEKGASLESRNNVRSCCDPISSHHSEWKYSSVLCL